MFKYNKDGSLKIDYDDGTEFDNGVVIDRSEKEWIGPPAVIVDTETTPTPPLDLDVVGEEDTSGSEPQDNVEEIPASVTAAGIRAQAFAALDASISRLEAANLAANAEPAEQKPTVTRFKDSDGYEEGTDQRVKIRVPLKYLTRFTQGSTGSPLNKVGGILFPYTPSVSYGVNATYTAQSPTHSNFTQNFYKNSAIDNISINGKFTVQTAEDADILLCTIHLLKSLTRMRAGGALVGDTDSGAPPPVCRLDAFGDMLLNNVPVVISTFKFDFPDSVNYFRYKSKELGMNSVPTVSTISITCIPMYSRTEIQKFSVTAYSNGWYKGRGYI